MTRNLLGYRPDGKDPRDFPAQRLFKMARPPASADLSAWRPDIEDQLSEGSCTTFGTGGAVRTVIRRDAPAFDFVWNHQQLYNSARIAAGTFDQDAGLDLRTLVDTLKNIGVGHDELWPYDIANLYVPPPQEVLDDAFQYKALKYHVVGTSSTDVMLGIASGYPVILGLALYESWLDDGPKSVQRTGNLLMPEPGERIIGYHCMRADAYHDGIAEVPNQYGIYWGDRGVCRIPLQYFDSPARMIFALIIDVFGSQAEYDHGTAIGQKGPA